MKHIIPIILLSALSFTAASSEWTGEDKIKHAKMGVLIGAGSAIAFNFANDEHAALKASGIVTLAAFLKEFSDQRKYGGFDAKDAVWTIIPGVAAAYGVDWALNWQVTPINGGAEVNYRVRF